ncbi:MAG: hypothetical protein ACLFR8_13870, partial [Alkalispirochaeta sp.]
VLRSFTIEEYREERAAREARTETGAPRPAAHPGELPSSGAPRLAAQPGDVPGTEDTPHADDAD